jgi:hypothetical protein
MIGIESEIEVGPSDVDVELAVGRGVGFVINTALPARREALIQEALATISAVALDTLDKDGCELDASRLINVSICGSINPSPAARRRTRRAAGRPPRLGLL